MPEPDSTAEPEPTQPKARPSEVDLRSSKKDRPQTDREAPVDRIPPTMAVLRRERFEQETTRRADESRLRLGIAGRLFWFVSGYMVAVLIFLSWQSAWGGRTLSDGVLITLVGTTSLNVIGLLVTVTQYLFPRTRIIRRRRRQVPETTP